MPLSRDAIQSLIDWLGEDGAQAGLAKSHFALKELKVIATDLGVTFNSKTNKTELASAIVSKVNQRIDKSVQDLLHMSTGELLDYFEGVRPSKKELLDILGSLDFHPGSEAQKSLYKYAARQLSETGMFQRVATGK